MNYQTNSKYRKLKHQLLFLASGISFKFLHLQGYFRIALFWQIAVLSTFFFPWFSLGEKGEYGIFSKFLWGLGFLLFLSACFLLFVMFSYRKKEMAKQHIGFSVSDSAALVFFGSLQFLLLLLALQFMYSLSYFTKDLIFSSTPVYAICGAIFIIWWGILSYREGRKEILKSLYVENSQTTNSQFEEYREILEKGNVSPDKKNMSLPI